MKYIFLIFLSFTTVVIPGENQFQLESPSPSSELTEEDHTTIKVLLHQIRIMKISGICFDPIRPKLEKEMMNKEARKVIQILKGAGRKFPKPKGDAVCWVSDLEGKLGYREDNLVDISKFDQEDVVRALFMHALPIRTLSPCNTHLNEHTFSRFLDLAVKKGRACWPELDYVGGRSIKVIVTPQGTFDPRLYNRDNGIGAAQKAIAKINSEK